MLIDGIHIPLTAPFYGDGRSYLRKLEHNVGRYSLTPAAGMVALTAASEGAALSDAEIGETLELVGKTAAREKVLIAAIAKDSVSGTLAVAEQAAGAGFDVVLLSAPPLWRQLVRDGETKSAELMVFFRALADRSPLPVMLASERAPGYQISVETVGELAEHPNVIGLYDAELSIERYRALLKATAQVRREVTVTAVFAPVTRRMQMREPAHGAVAGTFVSAESLTESLAGGSAVAVAPPQAALKTRTKTVGFQVMAMGSAAGVVELWEAGVAGAMPRLGACAPQGCYEVYAAFKDGNPALAHEKEQRLAAADALMQELGIAGIKYGCDWNGYYGGTPRLPRLPLDAGKRAQVERALGSVRN